MSEKIKFPPYSTYFLDSNQKIEHQFLPINSIDYWGSESYSLKYFHLFDQEKKVFNYYSIKLSFDGREWKQPPRATVIASRKKVKSEYPTLIPTITFEIPLSGGKLTIESDPRIPWANAEFDYYSFRGKYKVALTDNFACIPMLDNPVFFYRDKIPAKNFTQVPQAVYNIIDHPYIHSITFPDSKRYYPWEDLEDLLSKRLSVTRLEPLLKEKFHFNYFQQRIDQQNPFKNNLGNE